MNSGDCRDIGGSNRNLLDFNDLHIDREGRVYVAFADGCTGECATKENASAEDSRDGRGAVYYLASGPSLYEAFGLMAPIMVDQYYGTIWVLTTLACTPKTSRVQP